MSASRRRIDKTFVVTLDKPATYFPSVIALWFVAPIQKAWIEAPIATEAANYVSSGPFILDTWEHSSEIILKPNPNWTAAQADPDRDPHVDDRGAGPGPAAYEADELDQVPPAGERHPASQGRSDPWPAKSSRSRTLAITYYNYNNGIDPKTRKTLARCTDPRPARP